MYIMWSWALLKRRSSQLHSLPRREVLRDQGSELVVNLHIMRSRAVLERPRIFWLLSLSRWPAGQDMQVVDAGEPGIAENLPAAQSVHVDDARAAEYCPAL
eukprot:COSAG03_NODE_851_length_5634_cov_2.593315_1_plen_100_part_10